MNIFITGQRNKGKSTLVKEIVEFFQWDIAGYQTIPYQNHGIGWSYCMQNIMTQEQMPISCFCHGHMQGLSETFDTFGVECLKMAIQSQRVVVMDEIGRFERHSIQFLSMIHTLLDSSCLVLAVLKAEPIDYIESMKKRTDSLVVDLDQISYHEAKHKIISVLEREERK